MNRFSVLFLTLFIAISYSFAQFPAGSWKGKIQPPGAPMELDVTLESDGKSTGALIIDVQGQTMDFTASGFERNEKTVTFELLIDMDTILECTLNQSDGSKYEGECTDGETPGMLSIDFENAFGDGLSEEGAIREAIQHYFDGHATGDGEHFKKVFHPASSLFYEREDTFQQISSADYIARANGTPPEDEAERKRWIESIDIAGNVAMVKVILDYPKVTFTDYMSMLKVDGKWQIVNKTFSSVSK